MYDIIHLSDSGHHLKEKPLVDGSKSNPSNHEHSLDDRQSSQPPGPSAFRAGRDGLRLIVQLLGARTDCTRESEERADSRGV